MTIKDEMIEFVNEQIRMFGIGKILTRSEIISLVHSKYNRTQGSIIPSDYCYNRINNGIDCEKHPMLLEYLNNGNYKLLGLSFPYNGVLYHKTKGENEIIVGQCVNGVRIIAQYKPQDGNIDNSTIIDIVHKTNRIPSLSLRFDILKRDNFKCCICGNSPAKNPSTELHIDHVIPWSKGDETTLDNLQTLCSLCNLGKRDK